MGNLSLRIKGPSAEEVQASSRSCLPAGQEGPPPSWPSRPAASGSSQVTNILLPLHGESPPSSPVEVEQSAESRGADFGDW